MSALFPTPILVCDIGGTNVRMGLIRYSGAPLELLDRHRTEDSASFQDMLNQVLETYSIHPLSLLISAAGPLHHRTLSLTNASWTLDGPKIAGQFGLSQGLLLNDFEALALSLPSLGQDQTQPFGAPQLAIPNGPQLILGPGTGLGVSLLLQTSGGYQALPSEAGHMDFGPVTPEDFTLWPLIEKLHGRVSAESLLSGPGLSRLHQARLNSLGQFPSEVLPAAQISEAALRDPQSEAANSLRVFWRLIAQFAGDMAICFAATGGVTLAGGILPKILPFADPAAFRSTFSAKAPMQSLLEKMPIRLIMDDQAVIRGLADIARHPERFAIDYAQRLWINA
jgi:glucokinase